MQEYETAMRGDRLSAAPEDADGELGTPKTSPDRPKAKAGAKATSRGDSMHLRGLMAKDISPTVVHKDPCC